MATSALDLFKDEMANPDTNYFIFDTYGGGEHDDIDFEQYSWTPSKYNLVKEGDLFIYRRPAKATKEKQFYFFGCCNIGRITGDKRVTATFPKKHVFHEYVTQHDLQAFHWKWKTRGHSWSNFFNQYGMNKIHKHDFIELLRLSEKVDGEYEETNPDDEIEAIQAIQNGNFSVDDRQSVVAIRSKHKAFADRVKLNYRYKCAICGMRVKDFLSASHIVPWSVDKDIRLDPTNGMCLCVLHHKAFDCGYITVTSDYLVKLSPATQKDRELNGLLALVDGKRIELPVRYKPNKGYLKYHQRNVFIAPANP